MLKTAGSTRLVLIIGGYALKIARHDRGRGCNLFEARIWREATPERKQILCPVLACRPDGQFLLMPAASPLSEEHAELLLQNWGFPEWDHIGGEEGEPFEYKASDWGFVDGRLVALDYSAPALFPDEED